MKTIAFHKMCGSGNDFIIIDNRDGAIAVSDQSGLARKVCRRRLSLGADGLILIEPSQQADFKWRFFNSDGSVAEMCGNGARCVSRFAFLNGIAGAKLSFETIAGIIAAEVQGDRVKIRMTDPFDLCLDREIPLMSASINAGFINTGVPHAVVEVEDVNRVDVNAMGAEIRWHDAFKPAGTNASFIAPLAGNGYAIRTYERGVEGETLACGTACVAAALVMAARHGAISPIELQTRSGSRVRVYFDRSDNAFKDVFLEGDARVIGSGRLHEDAWNYAEPLFD